MNRQSGFTLVEVLVTGLLATMITLAAYSLVQLSAAHLKAGAAQGRLALIASATSGLIRDLAYRAAILKGEGDPENPEDIDYLALPSETHKIVFCDTAGDTLGGIRFRANGRVQELAAPMGDWEWVDLVFAADTVFADSARSRIDILGKRRGIRFEIHHRTVHGDSLRGVPETVISRNAKWNPA